MKDLTLESMFGDADLDAECPACQHEFTVKFSQVMNDRSIVQCPGCNQDIEFQHDDTTQKTLRDSNKALKDFNKSFSELERTLKNLGK